MSDDAEEWDESEEEDISEDEFDDDIEYDETWEGEEEEDFIEDEFNDDNRSDGTWEREEEGDINEDVEDIENDVEDIENDEADDSVNEDKGADDKEGSLGDSLEAGMRAFGGTCVGKALGKAVRNTVNDVQKECVRPKIKELAKAPAKKPVAVTPAKKPVAVTPAKKPVAVTPAKKRVAITPAKKRVAVTPAKKPAVAPAKKPVVAPAKTRIGSSPGTRKVVGATPNHKPASAKVAKQEGACIEETENLEVTTKIVKKDCNKKLPSAKVAKQEATCVEETENPEVAVKNVKKDGDKKLPSAMMAKQEAACVEETENLEVAVKNVKKDGDKKLPPTKSANDGKKPSAALPQMQESHTHETVQSSTHDGGSGGSKQKIVRPSCKSIETVIGKEFYFWTAHGTSFIGVKERAFLGQFPLPLKKEKSKSSTFQIEWVDSAAQQVAIAYTESTGRKNYISCRTMSWVNGGALAEFQREIGDYETFTIHYNARDNSFLFVSHNNLYMHYNETTGIVAFKTCSKRDENGVPKKGRWVLLDDEEANARTGTRTGSLTFGAARVAAGGVAAVAGVAGMVILS